MRVASDEPRLDLLEKPLVAASSDAGLAETGDTFVSVDEDNRLDGGEAGAVPHRHRFVLAEGRERDADVASADIGDLHWEYSHGLMISIPHPMKSRTLRVATEAPTDSAIAAMKQSASSIRLPVASRAARIRGYELAAERSNGRILSANSTERILSIATT